jgi:3-methyladenine DNA glycosylase AlkD
MRPEEIQKELFRLQDVQYRDFQAKLIPNIPPEAMIGVRTPALRSLAKQLARQEETREFLCLLPHRYFDENQLHAFILSELKDYDRCMDEVCRFLPYVDNWATCDTLIPKVFAKHHSELLQHIMVWIASDKTYTVRYAIGTLMRYFLNDEFDVKYPKMVAKVRSEEYYVNMMIAWYFATALAKQYDAVLPYIEERKLDKWTHNKTIQKAIESFRVTPEHKEYLKTLKY